MSETASEPSYYRSSIQVKNSTCEPCSGHRINQHVDAQICPLFENDTFLVFHKVQPILKAASISLKRNMEQLQNDLGADRQFSPYTIPDLEDIENSSINKSLKRETRPEQILHYSYARVLLVHSFLAEAREILKREREGTFNDSELHTIIDNLGDAACNLYDFTFMLHVSNIDDEVCTYIKSLKLTDRYDAWNYVLSIFNYTETILDLVVKDISDLDSPSVKCSCRYRCRKRIKLVCKTQGKKYRQKKCKQRRKCKGKERGCKKRESRKRRKDNARKNKRRRNKKCRKRKESKRKCINVKTDE